MKLSSVSVSTPGDPGDVSRTTNIWLDRLAKDKGLHLCRPPPKTGSGRYTDGVTWETAAQEGHNGGLRGNSRLQNNGDIPGFFKSGDRLPRGRDGLPQGEERRTMSLVCLAWCRPPVFRSPSF